MELSPGTFSGTSSGTSGAASGPGTSSTGDASNANDDEPTDMEATAKPRFAPDIKQPSKLDGFAKSSTTGRRKQGEPERRTNHYNLSGNNTMDELLRSLPFSNQQSIGEILQRIPRVGIDIEAFGRGNAAGIRNQMDGRINGQQAGQRPSTPSRKALPRWPPCELTGGPEDSLLH